MTPLTHAAVGLVAWKYFSRRENLKALAAFLLVSCLPDLDFVLYYLLGRPRIFTHQLYSHNILFAIMSAIVFFPLLKSARERRGLVLIALSHLVMDVFVVDDVPPIGFRPFWPVSRLLVSFGFFPYVRRGSLEQVLTLNNFFAFGLELTIFVLPAFLLCRRELAFLWRSRVLKKKIQPTGSQ
jgi:membrane-bound metal-dependent hydrolase YbcI (DUF457 family)